MPARFEFADPVWFRVPLKALVLAVTVFGFVSLYPAFGAGEWERAAFGLAVVLAFAAVAAVFAVAIADSYVVADDHALEVRFEALFHLTVAVANVATVRYVERQPRWRYRWGLSTNMRDRIVCSHGGPLVEIEFEAPVAVRVGPRTLRVTRLWLGVLEGDAFIARMRRGADAARQVARAA
jgi:hypothetical protein